MYRIGEVARLTGLSAKTIRFYEEIGLIPHARRSNPSYASPGYRAYSDADVRRLALVKRAKLLNLSLDQIKQLVEAAGEGCCETVEPEFHNLLEAKLRETELRMRELGELRETLRSVVRKNGRLSKKLAQASNCFTDDCGLTVPIEKLARRAAKKANGPRAQVRPTTRRGIRHVSLPILESTGCCEPECGPDACP